MLLTIYCVLLTSWTGKLIYSSWILNYRQFCLNLFEKKFVSFSVRYSLVYCTDPYELLVNSDILLLFRDIDILTSENDIRVHFFNIRCSLQFALFSICCKQQHLLAITRARYPSKEISIYVYIARGFFGIPQFL